MFFLISKLFSVFLRPLFWAPVLILWGLITRKPRRKKILLIAAAVLLFITSNKVFVNELAIIWEPAHNDTLNLPRTAVLLGGFSKYDEYRDEIAITEAGERLFKTFELYKSGKIDTIIISGGAASLTGQIRPESVYSKEYLVKLGVPSEKIWIDSVSKNTAENAVQTAQILKENLGTAKVILITSAFHMKRAVACFKKANIDVIPCSVQFFSNPQRGYKFADFVIPSSEAMFHFDALAKEWVGYLVYRLTGKI